MRITDFHAHAFPDAIADRAMSTLLAETDEVTAFHDGRLSSLLASMDEAGIGRAVVCSIATKPEQFGKILAWSKQIRSERVVPFPSAHPSDPDLRTRVDEIAAAGFKGVKLHPYYQAFDLDEERLAPLYEGACAHGLMVAVHTGYDVAFPRFKRADPRRIVAVLQRFPDLKLITTHLGAWEDWDDVDAFMIGKPIYMEVSYSLGLVGTDRARALLSRHPREYVLFGTDSPWQDQAETLRQLRELELGEEWERVVLSDNAARLLGGY
jgi:predicted TIM-barrel fold metal-dependent hydrolase